MTVTVRANANVLGMRPGQTAEVERTPLLDAHINTELLTVIDTPTPSAGGDPDRAAQPSGDADDVDPGTAGQPNAEASTETTGERPARNRRS